MAKYEEGGLPAMAVVVAEDDQIARVDTPAFAGDQEEPSAHVASASNENRKMPPTTTTQDPRYNKSWRTGSPSKNAKGSSAPSKFTAKDWRQISALKSILQNDVLAILHQMQHTLERLEVDNREMRINMDSTEKELKVLRQQSLLYYGLQHRRKINDPILIAATNDQARYLNQNSDTTLYPLRNKQGEVPLIFPKTIQDLEDMTIQTTNNLNTLLLIQFFELESYGPTRQDVDSSALLDFVGYVPSGKRVEKFITLFPELVATSAAKDEERRQEKEKGYDDLFARMK